MSPLYTPGKLVLKKDSVATDPNTDPHFANVSLLLYGNGINGSITITDNSPSPKTVTASGNAQISTAQSKFGGSSIAFDGTGDFLSTPANASFNFGTDNFTVEMWIYVNNSSVNEGLASIASVGTTSGLGLQIFGNQVLALIGTGGSINSVCRTPTINIATWLHIALVRSNGVFTFYADGVGGATSNAVLSNVSTSLIVGDGFGITGGLFGNINEFNGYIDDLRITKGVARYTANFTPPTAQFPNF
jgi:hypothetical protein